MKMYCYAITNTKDGTLNFDESNFLNSQLVFDTQTISSRFIKYDVGKSHEADVVARYEKEFGVKCKWETIINEKGNSWRAWVIQE